MHSVTMARGALQLLVLLAHGALLFVAVLILRIVVSLLLVAVFLLLVVVSLLLVSGFAAVFAAVFVLPGTDST